ncbi:MAG: IS21 family transposase [Cryomorphaceae bacterium]|nr:IS21 family transposase [Cryomorphaceae bacterium]
MAGKPKQMNQIKQLLQLHLQGKGKKTIARITGMSKNTVKSYLQKLDALMLKDKSVTIKSLLKLEDPELEGVFHAGNPAYKQEDERYTKFTKLAEGYIKELEHVGVTKRLLWEEYKQEYPKGYQYTQFCFHLRQYLKAKKPSAVLHHKPGDALFIDFAGKKLSYVDRKTGEIIECPVFVACLPYSDYGFAIAVSSQKVSEFIYALTKCIHFMGGSPHSIVPDNLKSAVIRANRYEPILNDALSDLANYYDTAVVPARVRKPKDKALVENQVKLIYTRVYARIRNQTFFDLRSLNHEIAKRVKAHNQTRMQRHPYCREEKFLSDEQAHLKPLPKDKFSLKFTKVLTVAHNNHIYLSKDNIHYSVPYEFTGQKVKVVYNREMVRIYYENKQVAAHIRGYSDRGYATVKDHLCSAHQEYLSRSPTYYIQRAAKKSSVLAQLIEALFNTNRYPEQLYRSCDGLFSLMEKNDKKIFEQACKKALKLNNPSYPFVNNILENKTYRQEEPEDQRPLPKHDNIRGKAYYQQKLNFKSTDNHE